jgi:hypothetical protein
MATDFPEKLTNLEQMYEKTNGLTTLTVKSSMKVESLT